jgi:alkanesulfonate monooxygenase SsuD/methylene tetrahydromethanopterin reductase-like flavin-dependent oxidoreductase (luciferase family)
MDFGLFMMPLHPPDRAFADAYDRDIAQIVLADRLGFREAWVGEHLTERWENAPAPDLLIAQALALTKNVKLGTGVTLLALHDPMYLAHRIAMLDHMGRGRFHSGGSVGAASPPISHSWGSITRSPPRCGPGPPRCSTSCSSSGPRTGSSRITAASSTSRRPPSIR